MAVALFMSGLPARQTSDQRSVSFRFFRVIALEHVRGCSAATMYSVSRGIILPLRLEELLSPFKGACI
jgi:hypothetical protein